MEEKTEEEKRKFLNDHFVYELKMMSGSNGVRVQAQISKSELGDSNFTIYNNALIESSLLHARNLMEFYYHPSDIRPTAYDYIKDWKDKAPKKTDNIRILEDRASKEVVHMDWSRLYEKQVWELDKIIKDLHDVTKQFLANLEEKFFDESLNTVKDNLNF